MPRAFIVRNSRQLFLVAEFFFEGDGVQVVRNYVVIRAVFKVYHGANVAGKTNYISDRSLSRGEVSAGVKGPLQIHMDYGASGVDESKAVWCKNRAKESNVSALTSAVVEDPRSVDLWPLEKDEPKAVEHVEDLVEAGVIWYRGAFSGDAVKVKPTLAKLD